MEEKFDYNKAVAELEEIARLVENPDTGIEDIDKYIKKSEKLISACRAWLRDSSEKLDNLDRDEH